MQKRQNPFKTNMEIITKRPEGMPYDVYKEVLRNQKQYLKARKKGFLVYCAAMLIDVPGEKNGSPEQKAYKTFKPFRGVASELKPL